MVKILFICHGNICRSTSAQYVMQYLVNQAGLQDQFVIDSAATSREEIGNPIYPPMAKVLKAHHIPCDGHYARQMTPEDYDTFDFLIGMDEENKYYMNRMYNNDPMHKFRFLADYAGKLEIADPWYTRDFEQTYQDVLIGCQSLLDDLLKNE